VTFNKRLNFCFSVFFFLIHGACFRNSVDASSPLRRFVSKTGAMNQKEEYWEAEIETLIECHLELQRLRSSEKS
jgi:hypothetical protein